MTVPVPRAQPPHISAYIHGDMGQNEGSTRLYVNTYTVPDDIRVYYEGKAIRGTGCFGGTARSGAVNRRRGASCAARATAGAPFRLRTDRDGAPAW